MEVRYKIPDKKKALDLIESAKKEIEFTFSLLVNDKSSNTIVKNIYESFRMLGEASLINRGIEPQDHVICISELLDFNVSTLRPLNLIEKLRKLRHNINYNGYRADVEEAKESLSIAKSCFKVLFNEINQNITQNKKGGKV